jgi:hypothetical protein
MDSDRIEFFFVESGSVVCLLARNLGGLTPEAFLKHWGDHDSDSVDLQRDGFFMTPVLYQDDSFIVRVVVGALTQQEESEWVARSRGRLNLVDGELIVSSAYDWLGYHDWDKDMYPRMQQAVHGGEYSTTTYVRVPPGLYSATIYGYLPSDLCDSWTYDPDQPLYDSAQEAWKTHFERTRAGEPLPDWLTDDSTNQNYVDFVVHLIPVGEDEFASLPITDPDTNFGWEFRRPDLCPLGIVTETNFIHADDYAEDEDED